MTKKIFKNKSILDLQNLVEELKAELFALRFQSATGQLEKPHRIKEIKREVARILTYLQTKKAEGHVIKPLNMEKIIISNKLKESLDNKTKTLEEKAKVGAITQKALKETKKAAATKELETSPEAAIAVETVATDSKDNTMKRGKNDGKK